MTDRVSYDPEEEFPWDCDLQAPGESDTQDNLREEDDSE